MGAKLATLLGGVITSAACSLLFFALAPAIPFVEDLLGDKASVLGALLLVCPLASVSGIAAAEKALQRRVVVRGLAAALFVGVLTALLIVTLMDRIGASIALSSPVVVTLACMVGYGLTRGKRAPDPSRGDPVC